MVTRRLHPVAESDCSEDRASDFEPSRLVLRQYLMNDPLGISRRSPKFLSLDLGSF